MKMYKRIIGGCAVGVLLATNTTSLLAANLTDAKAKEIAKQYAPAKSTYIGIEEEYNKFEVKLFDKDNSTFYEVDVDKTTQKPLKFESERLWDAGSKTVKLSEEDVKKIVLAEVPTAQFLSVNVEWDDGLQEYKVRFYTEENSGSYKIHPENGTILKRDITFGGAQWIKATLGQTGNTTHTNVNMGTTTNNNTNTTTNANTTTNTNITNQTPISSPVQMPSQTTGTSQISVEQAKQIALSKAPGAVLRKIKLDREHGRLVYEGELRKGYIEYDFEIDAATGAILEWDVDYDD